MSTESGVLAAVRALATRASGWLRARSSDQAREVASGVALFSLLSFVVFKIGRAAWLGWTSGSWVSPLLRVPGSLGEDVAVAGALGLFAYALGLTLARRVAWPLSFVPVLGVAVFVPMDFMAYRLTGSPLTWQRLQGQEGATLKDVTLLSTTDFWLGGGLIALFVVAACACFWKAGSLGRSRARATWPRLAAFAALGVALALARKSIGWQDYGLGNNSVVVLAQSIFDDGSSRSVRADRVAWAELLRANGAGEKAEPLPLRPERPRNVVLFLAEGVPYKRTSFGDRERDPTPNLRKRFERHGVLFERYYATWHSSIQAIFSVVCSQFPPIRMPNVVRVKPRIDCGELSEVFARQGYHPGLFHGGKFSYYSKLALLGGRKYEIAEDAEEFAKGGKYPLGEWGTDDRAMVEHLMRWVDSLPKDEPFVAVVIPITAHYPYDTPRDFPRRFGDDDQLARFLNAVAFQDAVFEEMLSEFEKRGLYDSTVFAWLGDHGNSVKEPLRETPGLRQFYQPNLHTPLVLINPKTFGPKTVSRRLGSHVDLVPTLLDLVGKKADPRARGQSLVAEGYEPRRAFFGAHDGFVGFVEGDQKFVYGHRNGRVEVYDLEKDPEELENVASKLSSTERDEKVALVQRFIASVNGYFDEVPELTESVNVRNLHEVILREGDLRYRRKSGEVASCEPGEAPNSRRCPGLKGAVEIHTMPERSRVRTCIRFDAPEEGGALELDVENPAALALISGGSFALVKSASGARVYATVVVDGKEQKRVKATKKGKRLEHPRATQSLQIRVTTEKLGKKRPRLCLSLAPAQTVAKALVGR